MKYGFNEHESINGLFEFSGGIVCGLHPKKITISDSSLEFAYAVGGQHVSRAYTLTKSDGKITSFTNPDGTITEVLRDG